MKRTPEPEVMDDEEEVRAYREGDFRRVNRLCARRALRAAGKPRGRAIDLGTGPAEIPIHLCEMAPGWNVTAVDASPEMLRAARENVLRSGLARRIRLLRGDAKRVQGLRPGFDLVLSNSLLHHLEDPLPFWKEVARLAAPGGAVCIQDLFRPTSRAETLRLVKRHTIGASPLLRQLFHQSLLAAFTPEEVRAQLAAAGMEGLSVRKVSDRHMAVTGTPRPSNGRRAVRSGR